MFQVKDVVTPNGGNKKQFFRSVGYESFDTGEMVQVREFIGEHSKEELEAQKAEILVRLAEMNEKISHFV